jgi:hypothetical protein
MPQQGLDIHRSSPTLETENSVAYYLRMKRARRCGMIPALMAKDHRRIVVRNTAFETS